MLMLADILSSSCTFWMPTTYASVHVSTSISTTTKRDIIEAFLLLKRCKKELTLLKTDMSNVISYWELRANTAKVSLKTLSDEAGQDVLYNRGCVCILKKKLLEIETILTQCVSSFSGTGIISSDRPDLDLPVAFDTESDSDSSDSSDFSDNDSSVDDSDSFY